MCLLPNTAEPQDAQVNDDLSTGPFPAHPRLLESLREHDLAARFGNPAAQRHPRGDAPKSKSFQGDASLISGHLFVRGPRSSGRPRTILSHLDGKEVQQLVQVVLVPTGELAFANSA